MTALSINLPFTGIWRMTLPGRFLPVMQAISSITDRPLLGESGHWDASSKSHIHDIHERLLSARSGHSLWLGGRTARAGMYSPRGFEPVLHARETRLEPFSDVLFWRDTFRDTLRDAYEIVQRRLAGRLRGVNRHSA